MKNPGTALKGNKTELHLSPFEPSPPLLPPSSSSSCVCLRTIPGELPGGGKPVRVTTPPPGGGIRHLELSGRGNTSRGNPPSRGIRPLSSSCVCLGTVPGELSGSGVPVEVTPTPRLSITEFILCLFRDSSWRVAR